MAARHPAPAAFAGAHAMTFLALWLAASIPAGLFVGAFIHEGQR
jgi:hypothetical protein